MTRKKPDSGVLYVVATVIIATLMGGIVQKCQGNATSKKTEIKNNTTKKNLNTYVLNAAKSR